MSTIALEAGTVPRGTSVSDIFPARPDQETREHIQRQHLDRLRPLDRLVLRCLDSYSDRAAWSCPAVETIASYAGVSMSTARRALRRLERQGVIEVRLLAGVDTRQGRTNAYRIAWARCGCVGPFDIHGQAARPTFAPRGPRKALSARWWPGGRKDRDRRAPAQGYPHPVNSDRGTSLTPQVNLDRPGLNRASACMASVTGQHRLGSDGFCVACGYPPGWHA